MGEVETVEASRHRQQGGGLKKPCFFGRNSTLTDQLPGQGPPLTRCSGFPIGVCLLSLCTVLSTCHVQCS